MAQSGDKGNTRTMKYNFDLFPLGETAPLSWCLVTLRILLKRDRRTWYAFDSICGFCSTNAEISSLFMNDISRECYIKLAIVNKTET